MSTDAPPLAAPPPSLHLPLLLLVLAVFGWLLFQTIELTVERDRMATARQSQEQALQDGTKLRQLLGTLGTRVAQLAESGNASAKAIVDDLRRQGITIKTGP
jgi:hypothetical protein